MHNNIKFIRKLPIPMDLKAQFPLKAEYEKETAIVNAEKDL